MFTHTLLLEINIIIFILLYQRIKSFWITWMASKVQSFVVDVAGVMTTFTSGVGG